jgi:hypothetical protein
MFTHRHVLALLLAAASLGGLGLMMAPITRPKLTGPARKAEEPLRLGVWTFSPDGPKPRDGVALHQLAGAAEYARACLLPPHKLPATFARFSPDGKRLVSVHCEEHLMESDHEIRLWEVGGAKGVKDAGRLFRSDERVVGGYLGWSLRWLAFSPDGRLLATRHEWDRAIVWDVGTGKEIRRLETKGLALAFTADGKRLVCVSRAGQVRHWDVATGECHDPLGGAAPDSFIYVAAAVASDDGTTLALTDGHAVVVKDARTGRLVRHLGHLGEVHYLALSPDGKTLAAEHRWPDTCGSLFDVCSGRYVGGWNERLGADAGCPAFSADGKTLAAGECAAYTCIVAALRRARPPAKERDPSGGKLEVTVVSQKRSYAPDLGGETPARFARRFDVAEEEVPRGAEVDLEVKIRNVSGEVIVLDKEVDVSLHVVGPGAVNPPDLRGQTSPVFGERPRLTLEPGESHVLPVARLQWSRWLLPGEYTLHATCFVSSPWDVRDGFRFAGGKTCAHLDATPLRVNVVAEGDRAID